MRIETKELKEVLEKATLYYEKDCLISINSHLFFKDNNIISFNNKDGIIIPFNMNINFNVVADYFYKIVNNIKNEFIDFEIEGDFLLLKSGRIKSKMNLFNSECIEFNYDDNWVELPNNFNEGIKLCSYFKTNFITNYKGYLNTIYFHKNKITSTDNKRICEFVMENELKEEFFIDLDSIVKLRKLNIKYYQIKNNKIYFKCDDNIIFWTMKKEADFPENYQRLFDMIEYENIIFPDNLLENIKVIEIMIDKEDTQRTLIININENIIKCKSKNDYGWIENEIDIDFKGNIDFEINFDFFKEILRKTKKIAVSIKDRKILFELDNFRQISMLIVRG